MPRIRKLPIRVLLLKGNPDFDSVLERGVPDFRDFPTHSAKLFWKLPDENTPKWVLNLFGGQGLESVIKTRSVSAVLVIKTAERTFAVTFGHGASMIASHLIEPQFGLKVVLNRVDPENLRSVDAKSLDGSLGHKREQLPALSSLTNFGIDIERDFLRAVTGISRDRSIGETISGSNAYCASVAVDLTTLPAYLELLLEAYEDDAYKTNFEFIDNIAEVLPGRARELDEKLLVKLQNRQWEGIWLAPPDIIDWQAYGRFAFRGSDEKYDDVYLDQYISARVRNLARLSISKLHTDKVVLLNPDEDGELHSWPIYKCLYADIEDDEKHCILSDGKWFEVKASYVESVTSYLNEHSDDLGIVMPDYDTQLMSTTDAGGNKGEARYNALVAATEDYTLLDKKLITFGGASSRIELCDLYKPDLFVHIKRYTRSSGLSHLFNQGHVSAELLLSSDDFLALAATKVADQGGTMAAGRPNPEDITVAFGVVSASREELKLPFFSQVALKNTIQFMKNTLRIGRVGIFKIQATRLDEESEAEPQPEAPEATENEQAS